MRPRENGCICGLDIARKVFAEVDPDLDVVMMTGEGAVVRRGQDVLRVKGRARSILAAERVALNIVGRLSGIATLTQHMVQAARPHKARIAATRKTTPGLRVFEKYAVVTGGGLPHRHGLYDAMLIKDNHIAFAGGVTAALRRARAAARAPMKIEIEVDTLEQLDEVIAAGGADIVMLDNMDLDAMTQAVRMVAGRMIVEASGGVTLDRIPAIAATGVDVISSGAITHSAPNFDVGLDAV
jgi:nicotinate-nucleotide pyrophosphorylase (carboxylating)